jgi:hypothetical protein
MQLELKITTNKQDDNNKIIKPMQNSARKQAID